MESLLVKFYTMKDAEMIVDFVNNLNLEKATSIAGEIKECIDAINAAKPLYDRLAKFGKKFSSPLTVLWCFINPFAKKKLLAEYNKVRDEAISIWKNPLICLEQLIDAEIDAIVAEDKRIAPNKELNAVIHLALLRIRERLCDYTLPFLKKYGGLE